LCCLSSRIAAISFARARQRTFASPRGADRAAAADRCPKGARSSTTGRLGDESPFARKRQARPRAVYGLAAATAI
jgi:hypothetical protein